MRLLNFILPCFFLFFACSKAIEKPKNIISTDKMVEILTDLYIYQQSFYLREDPGQEINLSKVDAGIVKKHGVSIKDFKENYSYYLFQPDIFKPMLAQVRDNLEQKLPDDLREKRLKDRNTVKKE